MRFAVATAARSAAARPIPIRAAAVARLRLSTAVLPARASSMMAQDGADAPSGATPLTPPPPPPSPPARPACAPAPEPSPQDLPLRPRGGGRRQVVTAFVLDLHGKALVVRRSDRVRDYQGLWGGVSGGVEEGDPSLLARALAEIREEAGLRAESLALVRAGMPLPVDGDGGRRFLVHPFLFQWTGGGGGGQGGQGGGGGGQGDTPRVHLNWENQDYGFVSADELAALPHVPRLPETLERVLPTPAKVLHPLERIAADRTSGASQLAEVALKALGSAGYVFGHTRTGAPPPNHDWRIEGATSPATLDRWRAYAFLLATARPSMSAVANAVADAVDDALHRLEAGDVGEATAHGPAPFYSFATSAVEKASERSKRAQARAIEAAASAVFRVWRDQRPQPPQLVVLTLSYSSMVQRTLGRLAELMHADARARGGGAVPSVVLLEGAGASGPDAAAAAAAGGEGPPRRARRPRLVARVLESRPLFDGVRLVDRMVSAPGWEMELFTDAQVAVAARGATVMLVGADAATPEGGLINKVGTFAAALVCRELGVPIFAVTDPLKVSPGPVLREGVLGRPPPGFEEDEEEMGPQEVTQAWADQGVKLRASSTLVRVRNVYFEATPLRLITGGVVTGGGEGDEAEGGSGSGEGAGAGAGGGILLSRDGVALEAARRRAQYDRAFGLLG